MEDTAVTLHKMFNKRSDHIPPVRVKGFTRDKLAELFAQLGFKRGAEIGVAFGNYSEVLCKAGMQMLCVDPYQRYYRAKNILRDHDEQENRMKVAHEKLEPYGATFIRKTSVEAAKDVEDESLDFVYIDGDHDFDFVMQDLIVWSKKVRPGGIVAGHDYYRFRGAGVVNAVDAYTTAHQIREWFLDDQRETSFFWAKT